MVQQDKPKNNLPDDATVHNLISDALYFLNSLEEYSELVNQIFTHTGIGDWRVLFYDFNSFKSGIIPFKSSNKENDKVDFLTTWSESSAQLP